MQTREATFIELNHFPPSWSPGREDQALGPLQFPHHQGSFSASQWGIHPLPHIGFLRLLNQWLRGQAGEYGVLGPEYSLAVCKVKWKKWTRGN